MSYPRNIDEYPDEDLESELRRRKEARQTGLCDYCNRYANLAPCNMADRHELARKEHYCEKCGQPDRHDEHILLSMKDGKLVTVWHCPGNKPA